MISMLSEREVNKQRYSKILRRSFINQKRPSLLLSGMRSCFFCWRLLEACDSIWTKEIFGYENSSNMRNSSAAAQKILYFVSNIVNDLGRTTQCLPLNCLSKQQIQIQLKNIFSPIRRKSRTKSLKCNKTTKEVGKGYLSCVQGEKYA